MKKLLLDCPKFLPDLTAQNIVLLIGKPNAFNGHFVRDTLPGSGWTPFSLPISLFVHNDMRVIVHWICWWLINDANLLFPPHPQSCPIGLRSVQLSFVAEATGVHWIDWQEIS